MHAVLVRRDIERPVLAEVRQELLPRQLLERLDVVLGGERVDFRVEDGDAEIAAAAAGVALPGVSVVAVVDEPEHSLDDGGFVFDEADDAGAGFLVKILSAVSAAGWGEAGEAGAADVCSVL